MKELHRTLAYYNHHAQEYAALNNSNASMNKYHQWIKESLTEGSIYDMGCGTGRDVYALHNLGYSVKGFDISQGMIDVAQQSYTMCSFEVLDMGNDHSLSQLEKVDVIWSCASLLHIPKNEFPNIIKSFHDMLNTDGLLFIAMKISTETHTQMVNERFFQYYEKGELESILTNSPFTIIREDISENNQDVFASYLLKKL